MPNLGQILRFLEPCDLEIWRMTLKNNRAPLLSIIKLYASFHHHMWIQTRVTVRKRLSWVVTSVTLTFDLWPWPFAWTSLLSLVITPENFMMIRWWEHGEKGVTDGQTDGQTDGRTDGLNQSYSCLVAAKKTLATAFSKSHVTSNDPTNKPHWVHTDCCQVFWETSSPRQHHGKSHLHTNRAAEINKWCWLKLCSNKCGYIWYRYCELHYLNWIIVII